MTEIMEDIKALELQKQNLQSDVTYLEKAYHKKEIEYNLLMVKSETLSSNINNALAKLENLKTDIISSTGIRDSIIKETSVLQKSKEQLTLDFNAEEAELKLKKGVLIRDCKEEQMHLDKLISLSGELIRQDLELKHLITSQEEQNIVLNQKTGLLEKVLGRLAEEELSLNELNNKARKENDRLFKLKQSLEKQGIANNEVKNDLSKGIKELQEQTLLLEAKSLKLKDEIKLNEKKNKALENEYKKLNKLQSEALAKIADSERILKEVDYKNTLLHKKILEIVRVANENGYKITNEEIEKLIAW